MSHEVNDQIWDRWVDVFGDAHTGPVDLETAYEMLVKQQTVLSAAMNIIERGNDAGLLSRTIL